MCLCLYVQCTACDRRTEHLRCSGPLGDGSKGEKVNVYCNDRNHPAAGCVPGAGFPPSAVVYAIGVASLLDFFYLGINPMQMALKFVSNLNSYTLLAVPFFILMGD